MDFYVYDKDLNAVGIIDNYTSVIWTLRYNDAGDFEIYIKSAPDVLEMCKIGYYVVRNSDNTAMIIKSVQEIEDAENGDYITISGVSVESILSQRIVWNISLLQGRVEECARVLVDEACINPADAARKIPNLTARLNRLTAEISQTDFSNQNVFDAVKILCDSADYGFKMTFENGGFVFEIYAGADRSRNQTVNDYVIFDADNLTETTFTNDNSAFKNVARIGGAGENYARQYATYGSAAGIERFEMFVDASSISGITNLQSSGRDALRENVPAKTFDGEISDYYTFGVDYALGDIVQIENRAGTTATARVIEIIQSVNESGIYTIPTFSEWGLNND